MSSSDPKSESDPKSDLVSHRDYLISGLMPAREFHLVAGSSGVGKTKLTIQMVTSIEAGESFFGHPTTKSRCLYVACDRGRDSFRRSLDAYGLAYDAFLWTVDKSAPAVSTERLLPRPAQILEWAHRKHPEVRLVVLDGITGLVRDACDYQEVKAMIVACQDRCQDYNQAVLGTAHSTKIRTLDKICNPRERVLGTVAWGGFSEMVVSLDHEDPGDNTNRFRVVNLCNHSGASLRWRVICDSRGQLVEVEDDQDLSDILDHKLSAKIPAEGVDRQRLESLAEEIGPAVSKRTLDQWIARGVETGRVRRQGATRNLRYFAIIPS